MSPRKVKVIEKDFGWNRITKAVKEAKKTGRVKVGVQAGQIHKPSEKGSKPRKPTDLVLVAAVNEFGAPSKKIPARSFIRATIDAHRNHFTELTAEQWAKVLEGNTTVEAALERLGQDAENKIKRRVVQLQVPGNRLATIIKKKSRNPLIDTGQLHQSIRYVIDK